MKFIVHQDGTDLVSEQIELADNRVFFMNEAVAEMISLGFTVEEYPANTEFRISVGDRMLPEAKVFRKSMEWEKSQYFSNSFGRIQVTLESCERGTDVWKRIFLAEFFCYPSKVTLTQFKTMLQDIATVCKGLLLDVVSKARSSFGWITTKSVEELSGIEEHLIIHQLLTRLEPILERINKDPASGLRTSNIQQHCYGHEHFSFRSLAHLTRNGVDPRKKGFIKPFRCEIEKKEISFDIWENRQIAAFCQWVATRTALVANKAQIQIDTITRDKQWRKLAPKGVISLWDLEDAPRIARLDRSIESCRKIQRRLYLYPRRFRFLEGVGPANLDLRPTPKFLQDLFYAYAYSAMIEFVSSSGIMFDKGMLEQKLKDTSRLYEYWVFILFFYYIKKRLGLATDRMAPLLHPEGNRDTYFLTLNSGDHVVFLAPNGLRMALYYEPTFFPSSEAKKFGSRLFRSTLKGSSPLVPDIYIELLSGTSESPRLEYGIVIDCKYSSRILKAHWSDVEKYQGQLFESVGFRNVADQLWIIHPGKEPYWEVNEPFSSLETLAQMKNSNIQGLLSLAPMKKEDSRESIEELFDQLDDSLGGILRSLVER